MKTISRTTQQWVIGVLLGLTAGCASAPEPAQPVATAPCPEVSKPIALSAPTIPEFLPHDTDPHTCDLLGFDRTGNTRPLLEAKDIRSSGLEVWAEQQRFERHSPLRAQVLCGEHPSNHRPPLQTHRPQPRRTAPRLTT